jgi:hypothetical protein
MQDNKPTEYSLSRADEPTGGRGVSASDLRIDPSAPTYKPNYATGKPADTLPNLSNLQAPPSVLRDMLREAEIMHKYKHARRKKKLYWYLFRVFFIILSLLMFFYSVVTFSPELFLEYVLIAVESAICGAIFALILAAIGRPIHTSAQNACFAYEFEELYEIEHIKDSMI